MKIQGLRILDSNFYHSISIYHDKVIVSRKGRNSALTTKYNDCNCLFLPHFISERLNGLSRDEAVSEIVQYYLDYSKISRLDSRFLLSTGDSMSCFANNSERSLNFSELPNREVLNDIVDNYEESREEFLNDLMGSDCKTFRFYVSDTVSSYSLGKEPDENVANFYLVRQKKNDTEMLDEASFFGHALETIMADRQIDMIEFGHDDGEFEFTICDSDDKAYSVTIPQEFASFTRRFVSSHNDNLMVEKAREERKDISVYQLKLEEF